MRIFRVRDYIILEMEMWSGCCRAEVVESSLLVRAASHGLERTLSTRNASSRVETSDAEKQNDSAENPEHKRP